MSLKYQCPTLSWIVRNIYVTLSYIWCFIIFHIYIYIYTLVSSFQSQNKRKIWRWMTHRRLNFSLLFSSLWPGSIWATTNRLLTFTSVRKSVRKCLTFFVAAWKVTCDSNASEKGKKNYERCEAKGEQIRIRGMVWTQKEHFSYVTSFSIFKC